MSEVVVVAFDPGETTGWSRMWVGTEYLADKSDVHQPHEMLHGHDHGQINGPVVEQAAAMMALVNEASPNPNRVCVVVEDFILRRHTKGRELLSPVRITAMLEVLLRQHSMPKFQLQQPAEAKNVVTDERLKMWGLYESKGALRHARDADRHALLWLRKCKENYGRAQKSWPILGGVG